MSQNSTAVNSPAIRVNVKMIFRCGDEVMYMSMGDGTKDFPGGGIEYGEQTLDTLRRELKEEIGYDLVATPQLVDVVSFTPADKSVHHVIIGYTLELPAKLDFKWCDVVEPHDDIIFHWINKHDIKQGGFYPNHERLLLKATGQL